MRARCNADRGTAARDAMETVGLFEWRLEDLPAKKLCLGVVWKVDKFCPVRYDPGEDLFDLEACA